MGNKKLQVWLPLLFSVVLIAGMFLGYKLNKGGPAGNFFKPNQTTTLQEAVDLIRLRYVDKVNLDSIQSGAIKDMMGELDPHSVYFPPVELKQANEELEGNFDGIGVEFNVFSDTVNIVYVIPGGPSDKAGLQIGDKLISVNDSSLVGRSVTNTRIRQFIRGERGSAAKIKVLRGNSIMDIEVKRGSIPLLAVDAAYMIDKSTGYIKLNKFTENSYEEFMAAMEDLQKQGMTSLIYDLRGNGGGFMNEAVDMADEFLDGDKLIVYTEGSNSKKAEYRCKRPGLFEKGKLVVLLDELSASASEVLAGALQDWDRATIIGRRSFGKGLVQEQYQLSDGSAIRLTTARYYTPLGRSIQRPYDKGKKVYMDEILDRLSNGQSLYADSNKINNGKEYLTAAGHKLFGGGGIMPDVFVPIDTATYPDRVNKLFINGGFNRFVYTWYLKNQGEMKKYASANQYALQFNRQEEMWQEFKKVSVVTDSIDLSGLTPFQEAGLKERLEALLGRFRWRNNGYYLVLNRDDAMVKKALETAK
ncbi:MAG: S41 family peptidase [Chitinophagaceae bacterium]|nr:MAG: S41 family peptidase [Chitinophagaceae bacterium]